MVLKYRKAYYIGENIYIFIIDIANDKSFSAYRERDSMTEGKLNNQKNKIDMIVLKTKAV